MRTLGSGGVRGDGRRLAPPALCVRVRIHPNFVIKRLNCYVSNQRTGIDASDARIESHKAMLPNTLPIRYGIIRLAGHALTQGWR